MNDCEPLLSGTPQLLGEPGGQIADIAVTQGLSRKQMAPSESPTELSLINQLFRVWMAFMELPRDGAQYPRELSPLLDLKGQMEGVMQWNPRQLGTRASEAATEVCSHPYGASPAEPQSLTRSPRAKKPRKVPAQVRVLGHTGQGSRKRGSGGASWEIPSTIPNLGFLPELLFLFILMLIITYFSSSKSEHPFVLPFSRKLYFSLIGKAIQMGAEKPFQSQKIYSCVDSINCSLITNSSIQCVQQP